MKSRHFLISAAVLAPLAGALFAPAVMAQQKYVVLSNVDAVSGQPAVGGKAAVPLQGQVQFMEDGNIGVTCVLDGQNRCPNIGTGSGGAVGGAPTVNLTAPAAPVTAPGASLSWTSTGAHVCYGLSATPTAAGWGKEWPANGSFSLDALYNSVGAGNTASYNFTLRCYSATAATAGTTPVVAYTDTQQSVTISPPQGGNPNPPAGSCDTYLAGMTPEQRAHYDDYHASTRGLTKVERSFSDQTQGQILGQSTGLIRPLATSVLPGRLNDNEYLALSFSMPLAGGSNSGKFVMSMVEAVGSIISHPIAITISPCAGDFRPRGSGDEYLRAYCRTRYVSAGQGVRGSSSDFINYCATPPGQTMYLNVALRNVYVAPGAVMPGDNCPTNAHCGVGQKLEN